MNSNSVEDRRTIELDVKWATDHDRATREARYSSDKKLRTNLSITASHHALISERKFDEFRQLNFGTPRHG